MDKGIDTLLKLAAAGVAGLFGLLSALFTFIVMAYQLSPQHLNGNLRAGDFWITAGLAFIPFFCFMGALIFILSIEPARKSSLPRLKLIGTNLFLFLLAVYTIVAAVNAGVLGRLDAGGALSAAVLSLCLLSRPAMFALDYFSDKKKASRPDSSRRRGSL